MCGISGLVGRAWSHRDVRVRAMLSCLQHRGPDEEGLGQLGAATVGARRLAILDLAHGQQPMSNEDGTVIAVQNGEIYNYRSLREDLSRRGHRFRTDNDTEVLPHLYEEHGADFPRHLRGMFAIALWDARESRLILTRDRLGKKPLLYADTPDGLAFASEIQALLTLPIDRSVDDEAIRDFLDVGYVRAPRSAFGAIRKVRPGHTLVYADGRVEEGSYWRLSFSPKDQIGEEDAVAGLRARLSEAVRIRLISDVPLGAFLSGGLDSSTIVALMASESADPVRTFSVGFRDEDFSELRYARLVAERFATDHHELIVEPDAAGVLPMLVRHVGEPFADPSLLPTYYVAKAARAQVTVALNGDGGDELFAGYDRYRAALLAGRLDGIPSAIRAAFATAARRLPEPKWMPVARRARRVAMTLGMSKQRRYQRWTGFFADNPRIRGERIKELPRSSAMEEAIAAAGPTDSLEEMLAIDLGNYLPGNLLVKADIASMAASVESRSPFLDHEVVEFMAHLPSAMKLRGGRSKYLLRRLMRGVLPDEILERGKMGFGAPIGRWLRGPLRGLVDDTLASAPDRGYVDPFEARRVVTRHFAAPDENGLLVWSLVMLELWFRYVEELPAPVVPSRPPVSLVS